MKQKLFIVRCRTPGVWLVRSLDTRNGKGHIGSPHTCVTDSGIFVPIKVQTQNSISFALTLPLLGPWSAALGWFSTLNGAEVVPYFASDRVEKKKSPVLHLFIFLLHISTVQRVYSEEINVTVLKKGKSKHRHVSHQSPGWGMESVFASDSSVGEGEKSKNVWCS